MRVGYLSDALPYAFFNAQNELVGLDVALMHHLAIELGVRLEFVPVSRAVLDHASGAPDLLRTGYCDILIGGIAVTTTRAGMMQLSSSYLDETMGFVVLDSDRSRFSSWESIRAAGPLTIAVPNQPYYVEKLRARLPQAHLRTADTIEALFDRAPARTRRPPPTLSRCRRSEGRRGRSAIRSTRPWCRCRIRSRSRSPSRCLEASRTWLRW